jgi:hypothetical protein
MGVQLCDVCVCEILATSLSLSKSSNCKEQKWLCGSSCECVCVLCDVGLVWFGAVSLQVFLSLLGSLCDFGVLYFSAIVFSFAWVVKTTRNKCIYPIKVQCDI